MDCSLPGSSVHGILRARTLEWVAAGVQPRWIQGIQSRDGVGILGKNLFNYRYRERLETDSVVGNIGGEKEAE